MGTFVGMYFYIKDHSFGHSFQIVEIDGVYTEPTEAEILYISVAQRYSILVTMKNATSKNYPIVTVVDFALLDTIPPTLQLNSTNWLEYNTSASHRQAIMTVDDASKLNPFDNITLIPYDCTPLLPEPDLVVNLTVLMNNLGNGASYAFFNNTSYTQPKVPTLYTVLSGGQLATNPEIYGAYTHPIVLGHNQVVDIVLNNGDTGSHPFHPPWAQIPTSHSSTCLRTEFYSLLDGDPVPYDPTNHSAFSAYPAKRDTLVLPPQSYFAVRFVADNPGVWIFHCRIDCHLSKGLAIVMVEAPLQIQERVTIPEDHWEACRATDVDYQGNAAGNTEDLLDLWGQNKQVAWLPSGFTAKLIVALAFSCVSAFLGMEFIVFYGLSGLQAAETTRESSTSDDSTPPANNSPGILSQNNAS